MLLSPENISLRQLRKRIKLSAAFYEKRMDLRSPTYKLVAEHHDGLALSPLAPMMFLQAVHTTSCRLRRCTAGLIDVLAGRSLERPSALQKQGCTINGRGARAREGCLALKYMGAARLVFSEDLCI